MKNIYTIFMLLLLTANLQAQMTISFEEAEGFELGAIHNQNGWEVTESQTGVITNQVISDEKASDGNYAFKNAFEPDFDFQVIPIMGAAKTFEPALDYNDFTISYDILITDVLGANFEFIAYTIIEGVFLPVAGIGMENTREIYVIVNEYYDSIPTEAVWEPNTWINIKMKVNHEKLKYYVDNELKYTLDNFSQSDIHGINMLHDNYGHDAYYDNIKVTSSTLGVEKHEFENLKIYPNPTSDYITFHLPQDQNLKQVNVYNITGKRVSTQHTNKVDLRFLPAGTYILDVSLADGQSLIRKVIKK